MTPPIFIGFDSREAECADVLEYSLRRHASRPLDIRHLRLDECRERYGYRGADRPGSTEFTYTRFLIPWLLGYQGKALFMDCDMLCFADICEVLDLPMEDYALRCVHQRQEVTADTKMDGQPQQWYPRKNWSSLMLMDCGKLRCWKSSIVETATGARLHRFMDVPDHLIGEIDPAWNVLDEMPEWGALMLHYTSGGPWFPQRRDCPHAELWTQERDLMREACS